MFQESKSAVKQACERAATSHVHIYKIT